MSLVAEDLKEPIPFLLKLLDLNRSTLVAKSHALAQALDQALNHVAQV